MSNKGVKFTIEFDNPMAVFFPGQMVSGYVHAIFPKKESYRSISVKCEGRSNVEWRELSQGKRNENRRKTYRSSEEYFHQKFHIKRGDDSDNNELEAGEYRFPFQFLLPLQLPSSFEGIHGNVRYIVKAKMNRPWAFDYEFKRAFTVNAIVDLNLNPKVMEPVKNQKTKHICCLFCRSGPFTARAWLDHTGYVPGETLFFCGEVDNQSGKRLQATKLRLVEKSVFTANEKKRIAKRTVREVTRGSVDDNNSDIWDHVPLILPPLAPSDLPGCNIISVSYVLEFVVDPATFSFSLVVPLEIVIGTVPLRSSFHKFPKPEMQPVPSAPPIMDVGNPVPPLGVVGFLPPFPVQHYPDLPPPSYEESMFTADLREKDDSQHMNEGLDMKFTPRYLTYFQGH